MKVKAVQYVTSCLNFWYQRKHCRNAQFTEPLFLQKILQIAIISTKPKFLFTRVDTGRGNAKTALLIPMLSDTPVCQIAALISECLTPALLSHSDHSHHYSTAEKQLIVTKPSRIQQCPRAPGLCLNCGSGRNSFIYSCSSTMPSIPF